MLFKKKKDQHLYMETDLTDAEWSWDMQWDLRDSLEQACRHARPLFI